MNYDMPIDKQKRAYELTFLIENLLRVSMHNLMVKKVGVNYFVEAVFPEFEYKKISGSKQINIVVEAKKRKSLERQYNITRNYDWPYLWYLDLTILIALIVNFWNEYFYEMFTEPNRIKNDIILRIENILPVRNAVAHHRYISSIDFSDLESLLKVLKESLNDLYINNFDKFTFNTGESLFICLIHNLKEIKDLIKAGNYIDRRKLRDLKSMLGALAAILVKDDYIQISEEIIVIIEKYNKLSRKPGQGEKITAFQKETLIENKIIKLIEMIGVTI